MTTTYTFDVERVQMLDGHLTVNVLAATHAEDLEDFELTVPVEAIGKGVYNPDLGSVDTLGWETFCEELGITDGAELGTLPRTGSRSGSARAIPWSSTRTGLSVLFLNGGFDRRASLR